MDFQDIWMEGLGWSHFKYELCGIHETPLGEPQGPLREQNSHLPAQMKLRDQEVANGPKEAPRTWRTDRAPTWPDRERLMGSSLPSKTGSCVAHVSIYVPLPGGAGFIHNNKPWFSQAPQSRSISNVGPSVVLSTLNIHTAILPVWELLLIYSLWPKPGLLISKFYVTPASSTSRVSTKFYFIPFFSLPSKIPGTCMSAGS